MPTADMALICHMNATQDSVTNVLDDAYQAIPVPPDNRRYHHLLQKAKEVINVAKNTSASYKRAMMLFNALLTSPVSDGLLPLGCIEAPVPKAAAKRGRPSNEDIRNRSQLCSLNNQVSHQKRKILKFCNTCKSLGIEASDHRKGGNCPNDPAKLVQRTQSVIPSEQIVADAKVDTNENFE